MNLLSIHMLIFRGGADIEAGYREFRDRKTSEKKKKNLLPYWHFGGRSKVLICSRSDQIINAANYCYIYFYIYSVKFDKPHLYHAYHSIMLNEVIGHFFFFWVQTLLSSFVYLLVSFMYSKQTVLSIVQHLCL